MATPVDMPQLGNTVEECILTRWVRTAGDRVAAGDVVAEIETDKTTFEVTSPVDGTVLATFADEGALVPVFANIFVVGTPGESVDAFKPAGSGVASPPTHAVAKVAAPDTSTPQAVVSRPATAPVTATAYSPRASRLAVELGIPAISLSGSGPGGRVLESDVRRAFESAARAPQPPARARRAPETGTAPTHTTAPAGLRATIARRMRESLASTAQYTLHASADATGLLALRARIKAGASEGMPDVTINDLVTFCTIQALLEMPDLNAEHADGRTITHTAVHIAFAVDTPRGLLAPVVHDAHDLSIGDLSRRMKELSHQAVTGTIAADDLRGATFTISNLGSLGVESFTPLINPPQVAILGVDAITVKPVRRPGPREPMRLRETSARRAAAFAGSIDFVDSIGLSLTCDHQVIDGAPGARFLQLVGRKIEMVETITDL
jgi:pyruvate dehydrogenase E2 component (dihydrolipoamide acetyltransferase)